MHDDPQAAIRRIRATLTRRLLPAAHSASSPLQVAAWHVRGEPASAEAAFAAGYEPFRVGAEWGGAWNTTWFRMRGTVPGAWAGRETVARVAFGFARRPGYGGEGLVWIDGAPVHGLTRNHTEVPLSASAAGGEAVELFVEAAANPVTQMDWGRQMLDAEPDGPALYRLAQADLACVDRGVLSFAHDFRLLVELLDEMPRDEPRWWRVLAALDAAAGLVDPLDVAGSVSAAAPAIAGVLASPAVPSAHRLSAVGHAHIDSAWLWPVRETVRKCARTFATQLRHMEDYPEFRFVCSQAVQYAWMRERYPSIYDGIRERVRAGQWEPVGSMWVEPDCNVPSGESLARQLVHGKLFFAEELGHETVDVWLPDAFGYSAALPQLIEQAGCRFFLSQKISWNDRNEFPHHTFWWEGIDGTRVLAHFPPADTYNGSFSVRELLRGVRNYRDHAASDSSLYIYGYGDGGGGPTREMLETARRTASLEGLPTVTHEPAKAFFERLEAGSERLAVWQGELYLEFHRGTYTTQAHVKASNRRSEALLREAELWCTAAGLDTYPAAELDEAWKLVLFNQFHDILPGSSINWVYRDTARDYERVRELGEAAAARGAAAVAASADTSGAREPVVVFNALSHDRTEVLEMPDGTPRTVHVPGCGYAVVDAAAAVEAPPVPVECADREMSNGLVRVRWDDDGLLVSVFDLEAQREVLAAGERGNVLQLHTDIPSNWDAWDVDVHAFERAEDLVAAESVEAVERGPLRAAVRVRRRFGDSSVEQTMRLSAGSKLVEFVTSVEWYETHKLLKAAFPVAVRSPRATYEIAFGHVERPTHRNTSWDAARYEVSAHTWADLSEPGYGVALVNDAKYGHDVRGHVMRLSLLRSPVWPDPEADRGSHRFTYGLLPHAGDLRDAGVIERAHALNAPLRTVAVAPGGAGRPARHSFVRVDSPGVVVSAVKRAERSDAVVVRLYEAFGGRRRVRLDVALPFSRAVRTGLLERDGDPLETDGSAIVLDVRPFEVLTLRLDP